MNETIVDYAVGLPQPAVSYAVKAEVLKDSKILTGYVQVSPKWVQSPWTRLLRGSFLGLPPVFCSLDDAHGAADLFVKKHTALGFEIRCVQITKIDREVVWQQPLNPNICTCCGMDLSQDILH